MWCWCAGNEWPNNKFGRRRSVVLVPAQARLFQLRVSFTSARAEAPGDARCSASQAKRTELVPASVIHNKFENNDDPFNFYIKQNENAQSRPACSDKLRTREYLNRLR